MQKLLKTVKGTELLGGIGVLICSLWIFSPPDHADISNPQVLSGLFLLLAPAFLVFLGCYRQTVHREPLGLVLILIGAVGNFMMTKGAYVGDSWGSRMVRFELCLLLVTCVASCLHTLWEFLNLLTVGNVKQVR